MGIGPSIFFSFWAFFFHVLTFLLGQDQPQEFHFPFVPCCGYWSHPQCLVPGCSLGKGEGQGPAPSSGRRGEGRLGGCYFYTQMMEQRLGGNPWVVKPGAGGRLKVFGSILYCVSPGWVSKAEMHKPPCESPFPTQWSSNVPASDGAPLGSDCTRFKMIHLHQYSG